MDPNQSQIPVNPVVNTSFQQPQSTPKSGMKILLILLLIMVFVLAGAFFILSGRNKGLFTGEKETNLPQISPSPAVTEEEVELNNIEVPNPETDIQDLQNDVNQL